MAKVIITIEDKKGENVSMEIKYDPPLKPPLKEKDLTPAQQMGYEFFKIAQNES